MSFSYRDDAADLEYGAPEPWRLFAQPGNLLRPGFWRMLGEVLRFYRESPRLLEASAGDAALTLADYLDREGYSREFVDHHLYPVTAAIWSCAHGGMGAYPAAALVRFFKNHGLLSLTDRPRWRTITGGSRRYVEKLTATFRDAIRTGSPVTRVERDRDGVTVHSPTGLPERYDHVVLACHADQAVAMLAAPTSHEESVLSAFPYAESETVLHSDPGVMPRRRAAWAAWNYHRVPHAEDRVVVTYNQNLLQRLPTRTPYLVTLNRPEAVADDLVHARMTYAHPQYDVRGVAMQAEIDTAQRREPDLLLRRVLGLWLSRGRRRERPARGPHVRRGTDVMTASAVYEGVLTHHRERPRRHTFRYALGMLYLDLDELPGVLDRHPLWSARQASPGCFQRADYLGPADVPLDVAVRDEVQRRTGERPDGPIRLLTHPRYWGWCFNPVSFYYVFEPDGQTLRWVVADVTNTPWHERHAYVLGPAADVDWSRGWRPTSRKVFHVSPFMSLDMEYHWLLRPPGPDLTVGLANHDDAGRLFQATLAPRVGRSIARTSAVCCGDIPGSR